MQKHAISATILRFLRRQQSFIAVAVAIYAALWAADRPASLSSTLVYTLFLSNFIVLMQDRLGFVYSRRRAAELWTVYSIFLLIIAVAGVVLVNVIEYTLRHLPGQTLWDFEKSGWKFPFIATLIFGVSFQVYRTMRCRLEQRNRELQQTVEQGMAERELRGQELQQALEIQQSLLPKEIPQLAGFEIDGAWQPARVVGGDYFDVITLGDNKLAICIGDVVGKSVSAALLMANVQASVRAFASADLSPSALCSKVNSVLCSNIATGKFVTFFYGVLDAQRRSLWYCNAGHLFPILIRCSGQTIELRDGGAVLGVFPEWKYEDSEIDLDAGDRLLLFTDGVTEAGLPVGEEYGEQRLAAAARSHADKSNSELKDFLLADVNRFCASQFCDDVTLLVISAVPAKRPVSPVLLETAAAG